MPRTRACAGPLPRLLGLAVVLFAVVLMHGATPESAGAHLVTSAVASVPTPSEHRLDGAEAHSASPAADMRDGAPDGHGDHGTSHPGEHCASAQPNQGPAHTQPRFAASYSEAAAPSCAPSVRHVGESRLCDQPSATLRSLAVQQI